MISVPVAVHMGLFKWQLDLFWHSHKQIYGDFAKDKVLAIVINRDLVTDPKHDVLEWDTDVPHVMCDAFFDVLKDVDATNGLYKPLNIQLGLVQMINKLDGEQVIEVLDCDMFHMRPHADVFVRDDELLVDDIYEPWHLKSLSTYRNVIDIYFENGGRFYNGGFVPIIGKVKTFRKILPEWVAVHLDILRRDLDSRLKWWGGMYALQAACEKKKVRMRAEEYCYIPGINQLQDSHYICHYSCDKRFDKKKYPNIDVSAFEDNIFYKRLLNWPNFLKV